MAYAKLLQKRVTLSETATLEVYKATTWPSRLVCWATTWPLKVTMQKADAACIAYIQLGPTLCYELQARADTAGGRSPHAARLVTQPSDPVVVLVGVVVVVRGWLLQCWLLEWLAGRTARRLVWKPPVSSSQRLLWRLEWPVLQLSRVGRQHRRRRDARRRCRVARVQQEAGIAHRV